MVDRIMILEEGAIKSDVQRENRKPGLKGQHNPAQLPAGAESHRAALGTSAPRTPSALKRAK